MHDEARFDVHHFVGCSATETEPTVGGYRHAHGGAKCVVTDGAATGDWHLWEPCGSRERLTNDLHLRIVLGGRGDVLPVATTATVDHVPTRRLHAFHRRCNHRNHAGSCEVALHFHEFGVHVLARHDRLDEHDTPVGIACHSVTAGNESLDV